LSHKQAILAYANLKMQSNDFSSYLGKQAASDVYGKVWVTKVAHIATEIKTNWQNAIKKCQPKSNHAFGLAPISTIPGIPNVLRDGGLSI
jgi:hypothetical protein